MIDLPYRNIPSEPKAISSATILARFIDGLGFRYRWATEGLTNNEIDFRPDPTSMNMMELINHIYDLSEITNRIFGGEKGAGDRPESFQGLRVATLIRIKDISQRLKRMTHSEFETTVNQSKTPFWYYLNGPIADALTHVGQITTWRRIAGNPQPKGVNVFKGIYDGNDY